MAVTNPVVFNLSRVRIEDAICEIIDNSLDKKARNVVVLLEKDHENPESFSFAVMDDGVGFANIQSLRDSMEIGLKAGVEGDYDESDIGCYHIGMKLSVLCNYNLLHIYSRTSGQALQIHAEVPQYKNKPYDPEGVKNPYFESPPSFSVTQIEALLDQYKMNTYVSGTSARRDLLSVRKTDLVYLEDGFGRHLEKYLGIIYQKELETGKKNIQLITPYENFVVQPVDPFWSNFSPDALLQAAQLENDPDLKEFCTSMSRFSTLVGKTLTEVIPGKGVVSITPYVIPSQEARRFFKREFPNLRLNDETAAFNGTPGFGEANSGSTALGSTNTGGIYFYRGDRCINFGGDAETNSGFYKLPGGGKAGWSFQNRIKVEYTRTLDDYLELGPNKDRFTKIHSKIWAAIDKALELHCGGENYAPPYNIQRPYFLDKHESQFRKTKDRFDAEVKCEHCELLHSVDDLCPHEKCQNCNKNGLGCTHDSCNYTCKGCEMVGHSEDKCPQNCPHCGFVGGHSPSDCLKLCDECNQKKPCPCEVDVKPVTPITTNPGMESELKPTSQGTLPTQTPKNHYDESPENYNSVEVLLFRDNRDENIRMVNNLLEYLDLDIDDLK